MRLYEISSAIAAIVEVEELTDEAEAQLGGLQMALEQKVESILQYCAGEEADASAADDEAARLHDRAKAKRARIARLKDYILKAMIQSNVGKVSTATFSASVAKSPMKVNFEGDLTDLPFDYVKIEEKWSLAKDQALADFKEGKELPPGVSVVQGVHLRIS